MPALPNSLRSLRHRDLQLFFGGQAISLCGTWMQSVAEAWLVYRLWHETALLGWLGFLRQVPVFFLTAWAGSLADRLPRRGLVFCTQALAMVQAGLLAWVTLAGHPSKPSLLGLAFLLGVVGAFDIPTRQAYLADMAGADLQNAIAFNSTLVNGTRILGPALAGYVVALFGEGPCFLANAVSYVAVLAAIWFTRTVSPRSHAALGGHLSEGVRYAWNTSHARWPLALVGVASLFALPYVVLMPVYAKDVFHGDAATQGHLLGAAGIGAFLGAVSLLRRSETAALGRRVALGATLLAVGLLGLAISPTVYLAQAALVVTGFGFMSQMAGTNTLLQSLSPAPLRGRVMGLYAMMFMGMGPWGSLVLGYLAERIGPRWSVAMGASVLLLASAAFHAVAGRIEPAPVVARPQPS